MPLMWYNIVVWGKENPEQKGRTAMRYYIKAFFGDWQEVTKEKADKFLRDLWAGCGASEKYKPTFVASHYREVDDGKHIETAE